MPGLLVCSSAVFFGFLVFASADVKVSHLYDFAAAGETNRVVCTITSETFVGWYGPSGKIPEDSSKRVHVQNAGSTKRTLVISRPVKSDGGDYECKGSKNTDKYKLYILIVTGETSQILQLRKTGVIKVNAHGFPKPTFTWKKEDQIIDVKGRYKVKEDGSLEIKNVKPSDQGNYTCISSILNQRKEQKTKIDVKVFETAKITEFSKPNRYATEGYNITFICEASGYPAPKYTWSSQGNTDIKTFDRFHVENGTLTIINVKAADKGEYACEVTSGDGNTDKKTLKIANIFVKPEVETVPDEKEIMSLFDKLTLSCKVTRGSQPVTVVWKRDGKEYEKQTKGSDSSVITFDSIRNADHGEYTCEASNRAVDADGQSIVVKKSVNIYVRSKPSVNINASPTKVYSFIGNKLVTNIRCVFLGYPLPKVRIFDRKNRKVGNGTGEAVFKLYTNKPEMFIVYRCLAENVYGKENHTVELKFAGKPAEPRNLYTNATCNTVRLFWEEPSNDGGMPLTQFIVGYGKRQDNENVQNLNAPISHFKVTRLEPKTTYKFAVRAFNRAHKGLPARSTITTKQYCRPSRPAILAPQTVVLEYPTFILRWRAPEEDGGDPQISYKVRYTPYLSDGDLGVTEELETTALRIEISGLKLGIKYKVDVVAVNRGGESDPATKEYHVSSIGARAVACATSASLPLMAVTAGVSFVMHCFFS